MSKTVSLKVSMLGQLRNAANQMDSLATKIRAREEWTEESDADDPAGEAGYYSFALREMADHVDGLMKGEYDLADFCKFYCLVSENKQ